MIEELQYMYLQSINLENIGPIEHLECTLPFSENGTPKPVVFVGQNGSGKSIVLAQIVNALLTAHSTVFDDAEIEKGRVYKIRSSRYIKYGQNFSLATVRFKDDFTQSEIVLRGIKKNFESQFGFTPTWEHWEEMSESDNSYYTHNFDQNEQIRELLAEKLGNTVSLFFPTNRYEDPAWLNIDNLVNKPTYIKLKGIQGISERNIINYSPLRENQNWLLDLIYDRFAVERKTVELNLEEQNLSVLRNTGGVATKILNEVEKFLLRLFQAEPPIKWGVGNRGRRQIIVYGNQEEEMLTNNLFSLSTGQTILLDIFLTIIRDFDLCRAQLNTLENIKGIVVIDEVDLHLHAEYQNTILPDLIALFPHLQFIMTSHSPLFLLGLRNKLGNDNFEVIELPSGSYVDVEHYSEFETAYQYFKESTRFERDLSEQIEHFQSPVLFTEGKTDICYLRKAAEFFERKELLDSFRIYDGNGFGSLDKISKHFDSKVSNVLSQKIVLLYDCDKKRSNSSKTNLYIRNLPKQENKIGEGIENLFPNTTIEKANAFKKEFFNIVEGHTKYIRGKTENIPEKWSVNPDEKSNLCSWLVENGTKKDFSNFGQVFEILGTVISDS